MMFFSEGILIPSPYYGGFDADLKVRAQTVPFPVYLSSKVGYSVWSYLTYAITALIPGLGMGLDM